LPIGFGAVLANIPHSSAISQVKGEEGFLFVLYNAGIGNELFPVLIFVAIGAMCDFAPLIRNPKVMLFAAAAQFGIFATAVAATFLGFSFEHASSIGIIGAADGPTTIYVASRFAVELLGPLSVAAYCYMSLVPVIQPPVIKAITSKAERQIKMGYENVVPVSQTTKFLFPIMITLIAGMVAPISVALIGSLMFGNLVKESGVTENLSACAENELANLVTLLLGITIGGTMEAERFLNIQVLLIMALGAVAFVFDTAGGVLFAKLMNLFSSTKINPMIGACGISAFPMSGRVIAKMALKEDPTNFIIQHAIGVNVAGQVASVVAGGLVLALIPALAKM
jgi:oxaloacetate decarboxylase beta subunit